MMDISHRVTGAIAKKNFYQTSPLSAWQLQKKAEQIFEFQQQIQTINTNDKYRAKKLQQKLKLLESQQGLGSPQNTPSSSASDCSLPTTIVLPIRLQNPLNTDAEEWIPRAATVPAPLSARLPEPFPAPASPPTPEPSSPIVHPRVLRFEIPSSREHIVHQEHKWGSGGLNPYTYKLLGGDLLNGINSIANYESYLNIVHSFDDDDVSDFYPISRPASSIDSGYESRGSNFL